MADTHLGSQQYNLPERKRDFNKAWKQYHSGHEFDPESFGIEIKDRLFLDFYSIQYPEKPEEIYLKRIHKILSYTGT